MRITRRVLLLVMVTALLAAACGGEEAATTTAAATTTTAAYQLETITPGTLVVATLVPYPGFLDGTDVDHLTGGLDWALANEIGRRTGMSEVTFTNNDFAAIVAGQVTGYDIAVVEIYVTPERAAVNDYSICYRHAWTTPIVRNGVEIATQEDLEGILWGVETGSYGETVLLQYVQPDDFRSYPSVSQVGVEALKSNSVEGIFMGIEDVGSMFNDEWVRENFYVPAKVVTPDQPTGICIAVQLPKGSPNLDVVNETLQGIIDDGLISEWEAEYLPYGMFDLENLPIINLVEP